MIILGQEYLDLVEKFRTEDDALLEDVHVHHILPRCCGGTDEKSNLVKVSIYHHVKLHKMILSNLKGADPIQREKLCYAYKKMCSEYIEPVSHTKKKKKPETKRDKMIRLELRGLHTRLKELEYKYKTLPYVDGCLLADIQLLKRYVRYVNYDKKHHTRKYKWYGRFSKYAR